MFFKTVQECEEIAESLGFCPGRLASIRVEHTQNSGSILIFMEEERARSFFIAKKMANWLGEFSCCLVWVTEYGIWPSSENLRLYYRLRNAYRDQREIREAPGHCLHGYEVADLVTLMDLMIQFGWGGHVLSASGVFYFSHDGWVRLVLGVAKENLLAEIQSLGLEHQIE